jgi:serine protease Do
VDQGLADAFGLQTPQGAAITSVERGSPAESAGIQTGDVVLQVNGKPVVTAGDLAAVVGMLPPGEQVKLEVWRNGNISQMPATLGGMDKLADAGAKGTAVNAGPRLGLTVRPVEPNGSGGDASKDGVVVQQSSGAAAAAGVRPGDIVLSVNGSKVGSVEDIRKVLKEADKSVALLVQRGEARIFVPVPLG